MQFATTSFIYQLGHVFALGGGEKRLKGESILAWFHFPNFLYCLGHVFVVVNFCLMIKGRVFYICVSSMSHFFILSSLGSQQLDGQIDHVAAVGSSFISCTTLGVRPAVTLIVEFPWVVTPGACLGKLFPETEKG